MSLYLRATPTTHSCLIHEHLRILHEQSCPPRSLPWIRNTVQTNDKLVSIHLLPPSIMNTHQPFVLATIDSFHDIQASSIFEEVAQWKSKKLHYFFIVLSVYCPLYSSSTRPVQVTSPSLKLLHYLLASSAVQRSITIKDKFRTSKNVAKSCGRYELMGVASYGIW